MVLFKNSNERMTSAYGNRTYKINGNVVSDFHLGIDVVPTKYSPDYIVAFADGVVTYAGNNGSYGNVVYINHGSGYQTRYAHQKYLSVKVGQNVQKGDVLGLMGATGNVTGPHLHFEVRINGNTVNPYDYVFNGKTINPTTDYTGVITYQTYTNRWLPEVNKCDNTDNGYAGIGKEPITGIRAKSQFGKIYIKSRTIDGNWLEEVCSDNYSDGSCNSYSGILGKPIDLVKIRSTKGYVSYRVKTIEDGWLEWVDSRTATGNNSYAGIHNHKIIGIQMK